MPNNSPNCICQRKAGEQNPMLASFLLGYRRFMTHDKARFAQMSLNSPSINRVRQCRGRVPRLEETGVASDHMQLVCFVCSPAHLLTWERYRRAIWGR